MKTSLLFTVGFLITIAGVTLVLKEWQSVVVVFQGFIGMFLAVVGLVILFGATIKQND